MMYLVDFDRTLFDTDAFLKSLPEEPGCAAFRDELIQVIQAGRDKTLFGGEERLEVWEQVSEAIHSGALTFLPGHLSRFLHPDASEFLRNLGNEALVITMGEVERQRAKVESALAGVVRTTVLYTGEHSKAEFLASWPGYYGQEAVLVDDQPAELALLMERFPNLHLYEMRRDQAPGDGRWPVVRSLSELP